MGVISNPNLRSGDPARILNGMDYEAKICGVDDHVNVFTGENIKDLPKAYYLPDGAPICVKECPLKDDFDSFFCRYATQKKITDAVASVAAGGGNEAAQDAAKYAIAGAAIAQYKCMPVLASRDAYGYCIPELAIQAAAELAAAAVNKKIWKECTQKTKPDCLKGENGHCQHNNNTYGWGDYWVDSDGEPGNPEKPYNCTGSLKCQVNQTGCVTAEFLDPQTEDGFFSRVGKDVYNSQAYVLAFGLGVATVLGFVYLTFIRLPGVLTVMIWSIILSIFVATAALGLLFFKTGHDWQVENDAALVNQCIDDAGEPEMDEDGVVLLCPLLPIHDLNATKAALYIGYTFLGLAAFYLFFCCCILRSRIQLAIGCVKEAAKAMAAMPLMTIYPVFQVLGVLAYLAPWLVYMFYMASSGNAVADCICPGASAGAMTQAYKAALAASEGEPEFDPTSMGGEAPKDCSKTGCIIFKSFEYDMNTKYAALFMLFSWFWTSQFIIAAGQLVISMSVATWFFTKDKKTIGNATFFRCMGKAMFWHLGTAAFGSLLIAIIKTIRVVIAYLQNKAKKSGNKIAQIVLCVIQCYMWCLEKCMKFLNKNAYIQTAIFGYSFCKAAKQAFFLILRNILRIMACAMVSEFVLIIGKLFIMTGATILSYYAMATYLGDVLNYIWLPVLFVMFISFFTADMFNEVFGMAISTILQCFVADEEMFKPEDRFAEGDLAATIKKTNEGANKGKIVPSGGDSQEKSDTAMP